jgi:acetoin utilization deacetylase AcuC-like enzyme
MYMVTVMTHPFRFMPKNQRKVVVSVGGGGYNCNTATRQDVLRVAGRLVNNQVNQVNQVSASGLT